MNGQPETDAAEGGTSRTLRRLGSRSADALRALWLQIRCLYFVFRNPGTPWYVRALLFLPLAYLCSPIQLIPNFIPVLGQMDDVFVIWLSNKLVRRLVSPEVLQQANARAQAHSFAVRFSGRSFYVRHEAPAAPPPAQPLDEAARASGSAGSAGSEP